MGGAGAARGQGGPGSRKGPGLTLRPPAALAGLASNALSFGNVVRIAYRS